MKFTSNNYYLYRIKRASFNTVHIFANKEKTDETFGEFGPLVHKPNMILKMHKKQKLIWLAA